MAGGGALVVGVGLAALAGSLAWSTVRAMRRSHSYDMESQRGRGEHQTLQTQVGASVGPLSGSGASSGTYDIAVSSAPNKTSTLIAPGVTRQQPVVATNMYPSTDSRL